MNPPSRFYPYVLLFLMFMLTGMECRRIPPDPGEPSPLRTLYVDHDSRGGHCSDAYSATDNASAAPQGSKPWCTLGAAGQAAIAGDLVYVRAGTYSEPMTCNGCTGWAVLELIHKGTATAPIVYRAYPGESPVVDPAGQVPPSSPLHEGVAGGVSAPVEGGAPSYFTILDGFRFQNWSFYDVRDTASPLVSQYAVILFGFYGTVTDVTIRNSVFLHNNGGGVFSAAGTARITFEYNEVLDNFTHGWTSAVDFLESRGATEGPNIARGNAIYNNEDDPPISCLANYCAGSQSFTNRCDWSQFHPASGPQGYGCGCASNGDCQSGQCVSSACAAANNCACSGDTEGHGIILDSGMGNSSFVLEDNIIFNNEGACISAFRSDGATIRNNVCWKNNLRQGADEIVAFTNGTLIHNNIIVPGPGTYGLGLAYNTPIYSIDPTSNHEGSNIIWAPDHTDVFEWGYGQQGTVAQYLADTAAHSPPLDYGHNTLSQDPQVVDGDVARNFHLQAGSPAIDSGDPSRLAPADFLGVARINPDRGAYASDSSGRVISLASRSRAWFLCYGTKGLAIRVCSPVNSDVSTFLVGYPAHGRRLSKSQRTSTQVTNSFGSVTVTDLKHNSQLIPSAVQAGSAPPPLTTSDVPSFDCTAVTSVKGAAIPDVNVVDSFGSALTLAIKRPTTLCRSVGRAQDKILCYRVKSKRRRVPVFVTNERGSRKLMITAPQELCVS